MTETNEQRRMWEGDEETTTPALDNLKGINSEDFSSVYKKEIRPRVALSVENAGAVTFFITGLVGHGKGRLARELARKLRSDESLLALEEKTGNYFTPIQLSFDDCRKVVYRELSKEWGEKAMPEHLTVTSLLMKKVYRWARYHLKKPVVMLVDAPIVTDPWRESGGSILKEVIQRVKIPTTEAVKDISGAPTVEDYYILAAIAEKGVVQKAEKIRGALEGGNIQILSSRPEEDLESFRQSMGTVAIGRLIAKETNDFIRQMIVDGGLPYNLPDLIHFEEDPVQEIMAYYFFYKWLFEEHFRAYRQYSILINGMVSPELDIPDEARFPEDMLPIEEIAEEFHLLGRFPDT